MVPAKCHHQPSAALFKKYGNARFTQLIGQQTVLLDMSSFYAHYYKLIRHVTITIL